MKTLVSLSPQDIQVELQSPFMWLCSPSGITIMTHGQMCPSVLLGLAHLHEYTDDFSCTRKDGEALGPCLGICMVEAVCVARLSQETTFFGTFVGTHNPGRGAQMPRSDAYTVCVGVAVFALLKVLYLFKKCRKG